MAGKFSLKDHLFNADTIGQLASEYARVDGFDADRFQAEALSGFETRELLERLDLAPGEIPRDIALELAKLDEGEISTNLTRSDGQTLVFLMLCGRTAVQNENATRNDVAAALTQQRLNQLADSYLDQLRADALIIER